MCLPGPKGPRSLIRTTTRLIIQNTNAYEVGFTAVWDGLRGAYWKSRAPDLRSATIGTVNTLCVDSLSARPGEVCRQTTTMLLKKYL
jgi:hypothetical protein